ncbi:hypothetical protein [Acinetobacter sp.]|uniref:hypothetical protein n=1 Tax=Acinetobacter sp. TaxID=472 RepID=UPI0035B05EBD
MFENKVRNQHYVSQVEQKLNCIDPLVERKKRRIYEFEVINRDLEEYILTNDAGVKIEKNLSINDLYTIDILSDSTRINFENFFKKFEDKIEDLTVTLLEKIQSKESIYEQEIIDLVSAKFINFLRNPFGIKKILNSFGNLNTLSPVDEGLLKEFKKINPQNIHISHEKLKIFNVSNEEYLNWLKTIFICLAVEMNGKSIAEYLVEKLFLPESKIITLVLNIYDSHTCLLSDRGYVDYSALYDNRPFAMAFNLNKNTFLTVVIKNNSLDELISEYPDMRPVLENLKEKGQSQFIQSGIDLQVFYNKLEFLKSYNSNVMFQCHKNFYGSTVNFLF